jgi:hypothetical protein
MAIDSAPRVLTEAVCLKPFNIGSEMVPLLDGDGKEVTDEDGNIIEVEQLIQATPGDVVDVSEWANIDSWERQGYIRLMTPDITIKVNRPEKTTGTGEAPRKHQQHQRPARDTTQA